MAMLGLAFSTRALLLACVMGFQASRAWDYRPLVSIDAVAAERQGMEIELGSFIVEHTQGEPIFTLPSLVVHDDLLTHIACVGELCVQEISNPCIWVGVASGLAGSPSPSGASLARGPWGRFPLASRERMTSR